jgi:predicted nuclease with TOPRIM domain
LRLRSQLEREVQNIKRKYDELNNDADTTLRTHKKLLQCLTCNVEGDKIVERELRALEMATESDIALQGMVLLYRYGCKTIRFKCY